jgi:TonB family protein
MLASSLMLSSLLIPAVANASSSKDDASVPTPAIRVSTGVSAPALMEPISIELPNGLASDFLPVDKDVELSLTVDPTGQASNVKVVKSVNPYWDALVVDAVQKSHFKPAKLDDRAVAIDMNLTVNLAK